jgi:amino acid transporter
MILSFAVFKLLPLVIVLAAAACLGFIRPVPFCTPPDVSNAITVTLLLLFSLSGFEIIAVPAGEGRNPRRDVPLATVLSIGIVLGIWMLLHLTLINTVPNLGSETRPVAASAERLMGPGMGAIVNLSAIVSAVGTCIAIQLAASRSLYAVAVDNLVPGWFAVLNPVQRVPQNAILFSSAAVLLLSACGSFEFLAVASALPRLIIFFSVAASLIRFRHSSAIRATVPASTFALPFGSALAALVMIVCVLVFATASFSQRSLAAVAILVGTFIYVGNAWSRSLTSPSAPR